MKKRLGPAGESGKKSKLEVCDKTKKAAPCIYCKKRLSSPKENRTPVFRMKT